MSKAVPLLAALVAGVVWGATTWLPHEADRAQDPAAARFEVIKPGLSAAGVFALLLAVRRQRHHELSSAALPPKTIANVYIDLNLTGAL